MSIQEIREIIQTHPEMNEILAQLLEDEIVEMRLSRQISEAESQELFEALAA